MHPPPSPAKAGFFHHDGMYARNRLLPLCVYSVVIMEIDKTSFRRTRKEVARRQVRYAGQESWEKGGQETGRQVDR